jgi:mono/diheme cytochrome c family protein
LKRHWSLFLKALGVTGTVVLAVSVRAHAAAPDFESQILPIFRTSCAGCHGEKQPQAGLRLDELSGVLKGGTSGAVVAPGNSRGSLLYQRIAATDAKVRMPPAGAPLSPEQVSLIAAWIDSAPANSAASSGRIEFARDIEPVFRASCYGCHSGTQPKSQLRLDVKSAALKGGMTGPVILPGSGEKSRLVHRVEGRDGEPRMPLKGDPLTPEQIATLKRWIDQGADWPSRAEPANASIARHWAYVKPVKPAPPAVKETAAVRNPIDNFILARLEREGLKFSGEASKEKLARRVFLDLTGLPPSPAELDQFLADHRPDAYER